MASIRRTIENALRSGRLSQTALFDTEYRQLSDSDPMQYMTGFVPFAFEPQTTIRLSGPVELITDDKNVTALYYGSLLQWGVPVVRYKGVPPYRGRG